MDKENLFRNGMYKQELVLHEIKKFKVGTDKQYLKFFPPKIKYRIIV